ncbi:DUF6879 family protein [Pseudonocardia sp. DLS-67]
MSRWIFPSEDRVEWSALLTSYSKSCLHYEAQQIYSNPIENARVADFVAGRPMTPTYEWRLARTQDRTAVGASKMVIRVAVDPLTDYTRMEVATYPILSAGGEDIRIVAVPEGTWPEGLPRHDFYIFDDREVWRMHYNDDFTFAGAERLDGPDVLTQHLRWRDRALELAIPLDGYPGVEPLPG